MIIVLWETEKKRFKCSEVEGSEELKPFELSFWMFFFFNRKKKQPPQKIVT